MEALRETTGGLFPPHIYLVDGNNLVSYIKSGETEPFYFKNPIKGFDKRGRKFATVTPNPFKVNKQSNLITVKGSNVPVQDLHLEVPANTWENMVKFLAQIG